MKYEILVADNFYHIYNCGNNKTNLFYEDKNYSYFLNLLKRHITPVAEIWAFALLKNHFHLLIRTREHQDEKKISKAFSNFFNAYAKAINKSYSRSGSLFQDRFKRILITDENYLRNLILYIHLNPEQHGFVQDFSVYPFSSYGQHVTENDALVERKNVISIFDSKENFISVHNAKRKSGLKIEDEIEDL